MYSLLKFETWSQQAHIHKICIRQLRYEFQLNIILA